MEIGRRIVLFEQGSDERAAYGEAVIQCLGADLAQRFGRGFGWRSLAPMSAFYLTWPADRMCRRCLRNPLRPELCRRRLQNQSSDRLVHGLQPCRLNSVPSRRRFRCHGQRWAANARRSSVRRSPKPSGSSTG
ncbi:DUF1016 N-terminal domain-containing protein [Burkholderia ambifaria]|uniref:DUF1016 N-terminal domain-containing protein n=1 Tax=Burkholderia ambifaria TaxID=152480 RepID=UPI001E4C1DFE|nr:DUF1016 N-terminal domain-containing protein [Burkholderia ambifaria]